jgi:hypothetical protein
MAFSLMASDLHWASWAWLRAAASCSRDARDCSSSVRTSEKPTRTRSHDGLAKKKKTEPRFDTHSEAAPTSARWRPLLDDLEDSSVPLLLDRCQLCNHSSTDHACPCNHGQRIRVRYGASGKPDKERRGLSDLPSRSSDNLVLVSRSCAASLVTTWSWVVTRENWRPVVAKSVVVVPRSRSSSDTLASCVAFSRAAAWAVSRAVVLVVAATVSALSAASSANVAAARSFLTSASASASLDASESRSVIAVAAAVSAVVAQSEGSDAD